MQQPKKDCWWSTNIFGKLNPVTKLTLSCSTSQHADHCTS
jgi:hypothetical protein